MRLADFIESNADPILAEWVEFARTCGAAGTVMDAAALRDHASAMLTSIVADLRTPQTSAQQVEKSRGNAEADESAPDTAAEVHRAGRADSGFTIGEMVSEYRALRATVLRLWTREQGSLDAADIEDLTRFNEAIDQSLAESVERYAENVDRSREMFVAVLGHDLRSPIGAVIMASQFMLDTKELVEPHHTLTTRIVTSARRMNRMVGDLLDFTRGRLGTGLRIARTPVDLGVEAGTVIGEIRSAEPGSVVKLNASGDLSGNWDAGRMGQVLSNLIGNAVQHGTPGSTVSVTVRGETREVVLQVHNHGVPIPDAELAGLFGPFKRLSGSPGASPHSSLGLGLYIVERIVAAHGGSIDVKSTVGGGTFFTVRLPRVADAA